jgi:hypothetical protein
MIKDWVKDFVMGIGALNWRDVAVFVGTMALELEGSIGEVGTGIENASVDAGGGQETLFEYGFILLDSTRRTRGPPLCKGVINRVTSVTNRKKDLKNVARGI